MNRLLRTGISAVFLFAAAAVSAQVAGDRLAVVPVVNATGVEQWDSLVDSMTDTIRLTLQLSGRYDIAAGELSDIDPYAPGGPGQLSVLARELRLDAAVIGRISNLDNGRIELEIAVWSNATGQIIGQQRREAFGSFDILDAADELVIIASSALVGYDVDFGALVLQPSRPDVPYTVSIDGIELGEQVTTVPQVLTGVRRVDITVESAGTPQLVFSAERRVRPGEALELSFGLPQVTEREQQAIRIQHELARNLLGQPERLLVAFDALSQARSLLAGGREGEGTAALRATQRELEQVWQLEEELFRLDPFAVLDGTTTGMDALEASSGIAASGAGTDALRHRVVRNGTALYHLLDLRRIAAMAGGDVELADATLAEMDRLVTGLDLADLRTSLATDRRAWQAAREEAVALQARRGRPWPYIGLVLGIGSAGYGGYLATAESFGLDPVPFGNDPSTREIVQWSAIGGGSALALLSGALAVRNARGGGSYLRDWVEQRYAPQLATLRQLDEVAEGAGASPETARVLVLGPGGALATFGARPSTLPALVEQPAGDALEAGRAPIVPEDATRLYSAGVHLLVVQ